MGEWLLDYMVSDETSCCYLQDGAESKQVDFLGQVLARRVDGELQLRALDLAQLRGKTAQAQADAFTQSMEEVMKLMEAAGADERALNMLKRFAPTCSMNDRASTARKVSRLVLGLEDGDDDPTCAEHALVNILEAGRKAMDKVLHRLMEISPEQAASDEAKVKAMRTCVGWFSSPACALIYQVAKYVALCSSKGYAVGAKFLEWMDARIADSEDMGAEILGHSEDLLAICGSRMYVFYQDAAVTERLLSAGSLLTYLEEEADLGAEAGGKLRKSILTGAKSEPCMAAVRAMAVIADVVFWQVLNAIKPGPDMHVFDVLPRLWPRVVEFLDDAAASPAKVLDQQHRIDVLGLGRAPASSSTPRAERGRLDMARIYHRASGDSLVEELLQAAFGAMAEATRSHVSEWLAPEGKLCAAKITPELRAKYDALVTTSTSVERLHALGRHTDERAGQQRPDAHAGIALAIFNRQADWMKGKTPEQLQKLLDAARPAARKLRQKTLKAQRIEEGRRKRAERDALLTTKRAKREAKAKERARIEQLPLAQRYSELKSMRNDELSDQLKAYKARCALASCLHTHAPLAISSSPPAVPDRMSPEPQLSARSPPPLLCRWCTTRPASRQRSPGGRSTCCRCSASCSRCSAPPRMTWRTATRASKAAASVDAVWRRTATARRRDRRGASARRRQSASCTATSGMPTRSSSSTASSAR